MHTLERFSDLTVWKAPKGVKQDWSLTYNQILCMPRETSAQQTQSDVKRVSLALCMVAIVQVLT